MNLTEQEINARIRDMANKLDDSTKVSPFRNQKVLLLIGSDDSPFLRAIKRKADKLGVACEITQDFDRAGDLHVSSCVVDHETFKGNGKVARWADVDRSDNDGMPCVTEAVYNILRETDMIAGKDIAIIGRGHAAKGLAEKLIQGDATVTVCHSRTADLYRATVFADVVVNTAPKLKDEDCVLHFGHELIIDVGGSLYGHWNCPYIDHIGPLTTSILLNRVVYGG